MICDPALAARFTPAEPRLGAYEACPSPEPLDALKASEEANGARFGDVETLEALEAFGESGDYSRPALARLYGGTRARVARGWVERGGRFESMTLISPYPDAALTRLEPGTLV